MRWTPQDVELLRSLYPQMTAAAVAIVMKRSRMSIERKARFLKLRKKAVA